MADQPVVVLIAGNPGYQLWEKVLFGLERRIIWIDAGLLINGGFGFLQLDTNGDKAGGSHGRELYPGVPHPGYYSSLIRFFSQKGWQWRFPQIDWRKKLAEIGPSLSDFLVSLKARWPLRIICHSAGGLFFRWALKWLSQDYPVSDAIYKVAGLTCAHWGAWHTTGSLTGLLGFPGGVWDLTTTPAAWFRGKYPIDYIRDVTTSLPNLYQLLPSPNAPGMDAMTADRLYAAATWADAGAPMPSKWLDYAKAEWGTISMTWTGPPWLSIMCGGVNTFSGIDDWSKLGQTAALTINDDGDGVLPSDWQTVPGMAESRYLGLNHNTVCQNVAIARRVYAHLI